MQARYSAFVCQKVQFVADTHAPGVNDFNVDEAKVWAKESKWDKLEIIDTKDGGEKDDTGVVEFKAHYKDQKNNKIVHHEVSEFKKFDGVWKYVEGEIVDAPGARTLVRETPKVGRNEPCSCGSGKKFKKCCGK
jgi:SEC-C motif-containing protein